MVQYARAVRGVVLVEKEKEYVQAARLIGVAPWRIMATHILPNAFGPILVIATIGLALAIIAEATLSFLGVGVSPTQPSLGTLIRIGVDGISGKKPAEIAVAVAAEVLRVREQAAGATRSPDNVHPIGA